MSDSDLSVKLKDGMVESTSLKTNDVTLLEFSSPDETDEALMIAVNTAEPPSGSRSEILDS
jgi:hypothetical protein